MLQPINNARTFSGPGFQDLNIWFSGPGFQDLNARFQDLTLRTWVSRPRKLSILRSSYLFSASSGHRQSKRRTGLCILIHQQDRFCHRKCLHGRLDSTGELKRRTVMSDGRTERRSEFIYKIGNELYQLIMKHDDYIMTL